MPEHSFIYSFYKNTVFLNRFLRPKKNRNLSTTLDSTSAHSMYSMRAVCIRAHRSPDARRTGSRCPAGASWVWLQIPRRTAAGPRRTWRRRSAAAADLQRNDAPAAACLCPEALRYKTHWLTRCRNHCRSTPLSLLSVCYQLCAFPAVTLSSKPNTSEIK